MNIPLSRAAEPPRNFSGGMQQRVQIAKALSNNPPILLLDEVTTGLDLSVQAAVLDLIQQIRRDFNVSMLVVSHDLGVIRMLADRTLVMLDGRVIESGLTDQILEDPQHALPSIAYSSSIRFCSLERTHPMNDNSCIIRGGTVVCADRVLPDHDVVVIDGRIAAIEPAGASDFDAQPDATVGVLPIVDARGAFVGPASSTSTRTTWRTSPRRVRAWSWT